MCGIVGIYRKNISSSDLKNKIKILNESQHHRGPDENGYFFDLENFFAMASKRLAIQDINFGKQPMISRDKRYSLIFNGEIINAPEIRSELIKKKIYFETINSDTEVLLQLLIHEGIESINKLNGMFAFAFYDSFYKNLILCRDRIGIKPLFIFNKNNTLLFSSELKSISESSFYSKEINYESLFHYSSTMFVPGNNSIYKNILKLEPGHIFFYNLKTNETKIQAWYKLKFKIDYSKSKNYWIDKTKYVVDRSIKNSVISDVPFSILLSSGIDSSIIATSLAKNKIKLCTYTLGFDSEEKNIKNINELDLARFLAKKIGSTHKEIIYKQNDFKKDLVSMVKSMGEPYGGGLPSWAVFKSIADNFKMALTGTGADEIFGNYGKWKKLIPFQLIGKKISKNIFRKYFFEQRYYMSDNLKKSKIFSHNFESELNTSDFLYSIFESSNDTDVRNKSSYLDLKTQLPNEFLIMTDHFSMAHSLEIRPPFLDNEIIDLYLEMPPNFRTSFFDLKKLLKNSFRDYLSDKIINAQKKGFILPVRDWMKNDLNKTVINLFDEKKLFRQGIFKKDLLNDYILPTLYDDNKNITPVWGLLMFQLWYDEFILKF